MKTKKGLRIGKNTEANNLNLHNSTTTITECEYFGNYEYVNSMRCFKCSRSAACTLRADSQKIMEKYRKRKATKSLVRYLNRHLGYPWRESEAYAEEVNDV